MTVLRVPPGAFDPCGALGWRARLARNVHLTNPMTTGINFDKLWADKKYQALHARKTKLWAAYVAAYVRESDASVLVAAMRKAEAAHNRALKRIYAYEEKYGR